MQQGPDGSINWFDSNHDFRKANILGETIVHKIFETGDIVNISMLADLVKRERVSLDVQTAVLSNPFHYAAHITDPLTLNIVFSMATIDLLTDLNQLGESPLSLAVTQDNAAFLTAAIQNFPNILCLSDTLEGVALRYKTLLHDIARHNAQSCFAVVKNKFTDSVWHDLNRLRVDEQLPIDAAVVAEHPTMFQLFAGYRNGQVPTLTWLAALQLAESEQDAFPHLESILDDAKADIAYRNARKVWNALEDRDYDDEDISENMLEQDSNRFHLR